MKTTLLAFTALTVMLPSLALAADKAKPSSAPVTRGEFAEMLRTTLREDPEILMEAIKVLQGQQQDESIKEAQAGIQKNRAALFSDPTLPSVGASVKDADVTIVEFFDYHCGYCKHMLAPLTELLKSDKKVRIVFIDLPILSEDSATAAQAAIAISRIAPDKYFDFYSAAMKYKGNFSTTNLTEMATSIGVDADKLHAEVSKKEIGERLRKNHELAKALGVRGTPALIVNDDFLPGALSYEELVKVVEAARKK